MAQLTITRVNRAHDPWQNSHHLTPLHLYLASESSGGHSANPKEMISADVLIQLDKAVNKAHPVRRLSLSTLVLVSFHCPSTFTEDS